ncbi:MAG: sulfatase-like hydrolase/transferase [Nocardioides sp.]|nr:sulfatase-like hydrolase/transferase [Nocardioides sp.]
MVLAIALAGGALALLVRGGGAAPQAAAADTVDPAAVGPAPAARAQARSLARRPNIVVVLMDDFSMDLVQTMYSAHAMKRRGASYDRSFVVDSLCCVSRSSFFTGQYPHQTGVLTNTSNFGTSRLGGWPAFRDNGNQKRAFNVRLRNAGYHTAFVGKYLNEYEWSPGRAVPPTPPGWSQFNAVFGSAYDGWDFASTYLDNGALRLRQHPAPPSWASTADKDRAYAGKVIEDLALGVIRRREAAASPYFLEVAVYAPHNRTQPEGHYPGDPIFPPMFRDRAGERSCGRVVCSRLTTDDLPGFGDRRGDNRPRLRDGSRARAWNTGVPLPASIARRDLRDRARMARSVDRTVRRILRAVGDDTYVVLTSDNGFHLGQQGLARGKGTAYATDVHVPLYVVGPGVVPGVRREVSSNIDLASTFEDLAGLRPAAYRSGTSLVPTFADPALNRRRFAFFEHTQQTLTGADPDAPYTGSEMERIPSYTAVRSRGALLVRLDLDPSPWRTQWGYEFYRYVKHSYERANTFANPRHQTQVRALLGKLAEFDRCRASIGDTAVTRACRRITR